MRHIQGGERARSLLLPASVEGYVGADDRFMVTDPKAGVGDNAQVWPGADARRVTAKVRSTKSLPTALTNAGGSNNDGTIFKLAPDGTFATLHTFDLTDGRASTAGMVFGHDGLLYGTTAGGGANDGSNPFAPLTRATDGTLYGAATEGGVNGAGTLFSRSRRTARSRSFTTSPATPIMDRSTPTAAWWKAR